MTTVIEKRSAVDVPTQLIAAGNRTLAYRSIGTGPVVVLCNRFKGILDTWDPAFLDALASSFTVITFDYSGIGRSTGEPPTTFASMGDDAKDLADALELDAFIIGGWSMGGVGAQWVLATWPNRVTHAVFIGTNAAGPSARTADKLFYELATKPANDLAEETALFFEPKSAAGPSAAQRSHDRLALRVTDRDPTVPPDVFNRILKSVGPDIRGDSERTRQVRSALTTTSTPILIISGDHDISFPVENWYDLSGKLPTAQHVVFPAAGHAPHHQYPEAAASYITTFLQTTSRKDL